MVAQTVGLSAGGLCGGSRHAPAFPPSTQVPSQPAGQGWSSPGGKRIHPLGAEVQMSPSSHQGEMVRPCCQHPLKKGRPRQSF